MLESSGDACKDKLDHQIETSPIASSVILLNLMLAKFSRYTVPQTTTLQFGSQDLQREGRISTIATVGIFDGLTELLYYCRRASTLRCIGDLYQ